MTIGETILLGPFVVRCALRFDNPAFPRYIIFRGDRLVGVQFSVPCLSDCRWHEVRRGRYATAEETKKDSAWQLSIPPRWKSRKADVQELEEISQ